MGTRKSTAQRRQEIAQATLAVIARDGLGHFTTAAVARQVGIAEGTIFRHFSNKEEIVLAAIDWLGERFAETLPSSDLPPLERLEAFFRARVALITQQPGVARLLFSDQLASAAGEPGAQRVYELQRRSAGFVHGCLSEAAEAGLLRQDVAPDDLLPLVFGAALALVQHGDIFPGDAPLPKRAQRVWATLLQLIQR